MDTKLAKVNGKLMRTIRKQLGQNQADFWRRFGVTQSGGCRYETGRDIPEPVKLLIKMGVGSPADQKQVIKRITGE